MHYIQSNFALGQEVREWLAWQLWCQCMNTRWKRGAWGVYEDAWGKINPYLEDCFADNIHSMPHSEPSSQNHGCIIKECRPLCLVPSLKECMLSILPAHPPSWLCNYSILSIQRRKGQRIKIFPLIHPWLSLFHQILVPSQHHPSYHPLFHQLLAHHLLLVAPSLHHLCLFLHCLCLFLHRLCLFLQQSHAIPNLPRNMTFLLAQCILLPPVVMLAAASFESANMMQDQQAVYTLLAQSSHQQVRPTISIYQIDTR